MPQGPGLRVWSPEKSSEVRSLKDAPPQAGQGREQPHLHLLSSFTSATVCFRPTGWGTEYDYRSKTNLNVKVLDLSVWWPQPSQHRNR